MRQLLYIFLVLGFVGLIGYWSYSTDNPTSMPRAAQEDKEPDFFIRDAFITEYDVNGALASTLESDEISHFPHNDTTLLKQPDLWTFEEDRQPWHTTADNGRILPDGETVELIDNVVMIQQDGNGQSEQRVDTDFLTVYSGEDYADTDAPVRITNEPGVTTAVGMRAFYKRDFIQLKSKVNSIYENK
ncbi:LPS export ABC transporter periplasmic protein LptC [Parendozoicomonas haliclonae]|uniref:Lipopolysaccharide export system protein LptC n=1 Tax=Parendozoicomonas haliclonae TaxID=1960125 RepID=A0A1X7AF89_9GAMM|nr:LPS export ABC transporter periplasmic protein LptC [Parendozoicomonas haliclonae]SMA37264.1 lipopolysaccharide exporter periplasmic protein [Parendozoicomonas haliclonae]